MDNLESFRYDVDADTKTFAKLGYFRPISKELIRYLGKQNSLTGYLWLNGIGDNFEFR